MAGITNARPRGREQCSSRISPAVVIGSCVPLIKIPAQELLYLSVNCRLQGFNHHFLPPRGDSSFAFLAGDYTIEAYARILNRHAPVRLSR